MKKAKGEGLLAVDVGNTSIAFGIFGRSLKTFRLNTESAKNKNFPNKLLKALGTSRPGIKNIAVASVAPWADPILTRVFQGRLGIRPYFIDPRSRLPIKNLYQNPKEVGADRIVNAAAAWEMFRRPVVVVDFGTAATFDCITRRGEYAGGLITPGPDMASESLHLKTAKLPLVRIAKPRGIIGKNPKESIQSGLYYGYVSLVDGILERLLKVLGPGTRVLATGGLASLIVGSSHYLRKNSVYPTLTLEGIRLVWRMNLGFDSKP